MLRRFRDSSARFDIEALRAFAVVSVMLYHGGVKAVQAGFIGVDIFFVISGYLIIGLLHRSWQRGDFDLADFWARRARRLLPASAVVIAFTSAASWLLNGELTQREVHWDALAALAYTANLRFAFAGTDYWSAAYTSPVLHFWSLGVEEQFYIVTPLFIVAAVWLAKRVAREIPRQLPVVLLAVTAITSFGYCIYLASTSPIWAHYSPASRAWEFAIGGLVALIPFKGSENTVRLRPALWIALFALACSIDPNAGWPNWSTALPVLITAALLRMGQGSRSVGEVVIESERRSSKLTVAWLGSISYSTYLWHWPLLWMTAMALRLDAPEQLPLFASVPTMFVAVLFADWTKRYVEDPFRFHPDLVHRKWQSLQAGWATMAAGAAAVVLTMVLPAVTLLPAPAVAAPKTDVTSSALDVQAEPESASAYQQWLERAITELVPDADRNLPLSAAKPAIEQLRADKPESTQTPCYTDKESREIPQDCYFGDLNSSTTVVLMGDSHAEMHFGGLNDATMRLGLKLHLLVKPSCPVAEVSVFLYHEQRPYPECKAFHLAAMRAVRAEKPALVILSSMATPSLIDPDTGKLADTARGWQLWRKGYQKTVDRLVSNDVPVLVVRDLPGWGFDLADCLATYPVAQCATTGIQTSARNDLLIGVSTKGANGLDLTNAVCRDDECWPIRAGVIVARDDAHISATYSHVLGSLWQAILRRELGLL